MAYPSFVSFAYHYWCFRIVLILQIVYYIIIILYVILSDAVLENERMKQAMAEGDYLCINI